MENKEFYRILDDGAMSFYDTLEQALDDIPASYKKMLISNDFNNIMKDSNNRAALKYTKRHIMLTRFIEYSEDEIEEQEEFLFVSPKTFKILTQ